MIRPRLLVIIDRAGFKIIRHVQLTLYLQSKTGEPKGLPSSVVEEIEQAGYKAVLLGNNDGSIAASFGQSSF